MEVEGMSQFVLFPLC